MGLDIKKLKKIKLLILDVDGVLTDCRLWMDSNGQWRRFFSIRDGVGIKRLLESGYQIAVITGSSSEDIRARVKNLGITYFYEGANDKEPAFAQLVQQSGMAPDEMAFIGDDVYDLPLFAKVGFRVTVPDAVEEVLIAAEYITRRAGGNGAVREVCDHLLRHGAYSQESAL